MLVGVVVEGVVVEGVVVEGVVVEGVVLVKDLSFMAGAAASECP